MAARGRRAACRRRARRRIASAAASGSSTSSRCAQQPSPAPSSRHGPQRRGHRCHARSFSSRPPSAR
eukprot:3187914-Prymnesium_polylepis.1